jgi:hypothetical protein
MVDLLTTFARSSATTPPAAVLALGKNERSFDPVAPRRKVKGDITLLDEGLQSGLVVPVAVAGGAVVLDVYHRSPPIREPRAVVLPNLPARVRTRCECADWCQSRVTQHAFAEVHESALLCWANVRDSYLYIGTDQTLFAVFSRFSALRNSANAERATT